MGRRLPVWRLLEENWDMSSDARSTPPAGIERVELKVSVTGEQVNDGLREFDLDADRAETRDIFFCERVYPQTDLVILPLFERGIILRFRRIRGGTDDSTLKLRGSEGGVDPELWRRWTGALGDSARIEGDWAADRRLVSASLSGEVDEGRIEEVFTHRPHRVRRLLSDAQAQLARDLLLGLDGLELLDPIHARKWKAGTGRLDEEVAAELWELDDGLRFLELSARVKVEDDPDHAKRRLEESVRDHGLAIDAKQQTKTSTVLRRLVAAATRRQ
jgi:hypothetical protein